MARILVIEDETDIQQILDYNLREKGHKVFIAGKGEEGLRIAREKKPDLVLLDLMLPDIPGTEVCKQLKGDPATRATQVVMLTAKGEEIDRVVGFELGADDYVPKPFSPRELVARVRALLRRAHADIDPQRDRLEYGGLVVDLPSHRVTLDGADVDLTASEYKLLVTLSRYPGRVYPRMELVEKVLGYDFEGYERAIDSHVKNLRAKLGDDPREPRFIRTVHGFGYAFTCTWW